MIPDVITDARLDESARIERSDAARSLVLADEVIDDVRGAQDERTLHLLARALLQRARTLSFVQRLEESLDTATMAYAAARVAADADIMVLSRTLLGHVFCALGHEEAAITELRETLPVAMKMGASPAVRAACTMALGSALRRLERFDEAFTTYLDAELQARPTGDEVLVANILVNVASAGWQTGEVDHARAALVESRAIYEAHGRQDLLVWQDAMEAWVEGKAGSFDRAIARAEAAIANPSSMEVAAKTSATRALARALSRADAPTTDLARARRLLEGLVEGDGLLHPNAGDFPVTAHELAATCARLDDLESSVRWSATAYQTLRLQQDEQRKSRHTAEAFRLRVVRAEVESEQLRLRAHALEAANRELEVLSQERAKLLAMIAHDMRPPLDAILTSLHSLRETNGNTDEWLELVDTAVHRMTEVLDQTLSTDAGRAPIRPPRWRR